MRNNINLNANIKVTEQRAPTDESVRLLKEMKEKTEDTILKSVNVKTNLVNGMVVAFFEPTMYDVVRFAFKFIVNGRTYTYNDLEIEYHEWATMTDYKKIMWMVEQLTRRFSTEILVESLNNLDDATLKHILLK